MVATLTATPPVATSVATAPSGAMPLAEDAPRSLSAAAPGFWVQLGAFRQRDGADGFHRRVASEADWLAPLLVVFRDALLFRLQAGPYASRDEARSVAERVREALQLVPVIVERR
jgi:rare lipoprotein A